MEFGIVQAYPRDILQTGDREPERGRCFSWLARKVYSCYPIRYSSKVSTGFQCVLSAIWGLSVAIPAIVLPLKDSMGFQGRLAMSIIVGTGTSAYVVGTTINYVYHKTFAPDPSRKFSVILGPS